MSKAATQAIQVVAQPSSQARGILHRACECGNHTVAGGECAQCRKDKDKLQCKADNQSAPVANLSLSRTARLQPKLTVGSSNDPLEHEADRIAEQVLAAPASPQRHGHQGTDQGMK